MELWAGLSIMCDAIELAWNALAVLTKLIRTESGNGRIFAVPPIIMLLLLVIGRDAEVDGPGDETVPIL